MNITTSNVYQQDNPDVLKFPDIVHFGSRPQQLCYAGSVEYQKTLREYVKYRHLLANMAKPSYKVRSVSLCTKFSCSQTLLFKRLIKFFGKILHLLCIPVIRV